MHCMPIAGRGLRYQSSDWLRLFTVLTTVPGIFLAEHVRPEFIPFLNQLRNSYTVRCIFKVMANFISMILQLFLFHLSPDIWISYHSNGSVLAKHLALPLAAGPSARDAQIAERARQLTVQSYCDSNLSDGSISSFVGPRILALSALISRDLDEAYRQTHVAYNAMLDYFSNKDEETNWIIPVLVCISNDLRLVGGLVRRSIVKYCYLCRIPSQHNIIITTLICTPVTCMDNTRF